MIEKTVALLFISALLLFSQTEKEKKNKLNVESDSLQISDTIAMNTESVDSDSAIPAVNKTADDFTKLKETIDKPASDSKDTTANQEKFSEIKSEKNEVIAKSKSEIVDNVNTDAETAVEIPPGVLFGKFSKEDGPFLLKGSVIVPAGQTLEFGPGCKIFVGGKYSTITVFGKLIAKGTPTEPVIFQSASKDPNPWDWDRIYCRSRERSLFENSVIRHSNYGIFIENGYAAIKRCIFERNSLHGLVVKNSDAIVSNSVFEKGHVLSILCQKGANVNADSVIVINNITGVACDSKSFFKMEKGVIKGNKNGLAVKKEASVSIIAANIEHNRIGVVTEEEIVKTMREMVYDNVIDIKVVSPSEMVEILRPPEDVKSIALPKTKSQIRISSNFKPGFSALKTSRETVGSFIGNVSTGFKYFYPVSFHHPRDRDTTADTLLIYPQNKYLGEHSENWYSNLQPEIIFFAQGKKGLLDVNLNGNFYGNDWIDNQTHIQAELFTMSMNYGDQSFLVGDFYENISESSITGRKLRGMKLTGSFWNMGRGTKRVAFKLAAGESEPEKDMGEHEVEIFGDTVDTGFSVRQQLTYIADLSVKPTYNLTLSARGLISRDQDSKPLFSDEITDTAVTDPVSAATGCLDAKLILFDGKMDISAELALGDHDTVDIEDRDEIAWYKPDIIPSLKTVFSLMESKKKFLKNYASAVDISGIINRFELTGSYNEIREDYFSAGNPYLESDRRILSFEGEKWFTDLFTAELGYEYELTSVSNVFEIDEESPTNNHTGKLAVEYSFGEKKPSIRADYALRFQNRDDMGSYEYYIPEDTTEDSLGNTTYTYTSATGYSKYEYKRRDNSMGLELKQRFENGIDYSLRYRVIRKNDFSVYPDTAENDDDDRWENGITGRFGFKIKRLIRNRTSVYVKYRTEVCENEERINFKVSDNFKINIVPRKLRLTIKGEYRRQNEEIDSEVSAERVQILLVQKEIETEIKYSVNSRFSLNLMGKYDSSFDQSEGSCENYTAKIGGFHLTYLF